MNWLAKSRIFRLLSRLPFGSELHFALQRHVTREWPRKPAELEASAQRAEEFLARFRQHSKLAVDSLPFMEIGAGRDLSLAAALRCAGVCRIWCLDIQRLATIDLVAHSVEYMAQRWHLDVPTIRDWMDLDRFGITYVAPADLRRPEVENEGIACFLSTEVMEHIPAASLRDILRYSRDALHPAGVSVHAIDFSDHYARSDPAISRFNFLTMSDTEWEPHNNKFQYVNRLRHGEYLRMFQDAGFDILDDDVVRLSPPVEVVNQLASRFQAMSAEDISALRTILVARKSNS